MQFLRIFVPRNAALSDGSRLAQPPRHLSCKGDYLYLAAGGHQMRLLADTRQVCRGDRQEIIAASGKKMTKNFDQDGTVIDLVVPPELLSIVRRACMRPAIGVALAFRQAMDLGQGEFTGAHLTIGQSVDRAARFELIEL